MAQTATTISAIERLEGEYATVLTLVSYAAAQRTLQQTVAAKSLGCVCSQLNRPQLNLGLSQTTVFHMNNNALSTTADWSSVETQLDLDNLVESADWSDAEVVAFVGNTDEPPTFFPTDVSRSGYRNWNIRILVQLDADDRKHLEVVLVDCDEFSSALLQNFSLRGRVDSLKRVEVSGRDNQHLLRCSRLIYRFLQIDHSRARNYYGFEPI